MKSVILFFAAIFISTLAAADNININRYTSLKYDYASNSIIFPDLDGSGTQILTIEDEDYFFIFTYSYAVMPDAKPRLANSVAFKNGQRLPIDAVKISESNFDDFKNLKLRFSVGGKNYDITQTINLNPIPQNAAEIQQQKSVRQVRYKNFKKYAGRKLGLNFTNDANY